MPSRDAVHLLDEMFGAEMGPQPPTQKTLLDGRALHWCWDCAVAQIPRTCWFCGMYTDKTTKPPYKPVVEKRLLRETNYAVREGEPPVTNSH